MERLPVADPERVKSGVRGELRTRGLAGQQRTGMRGLDHECLVKRVAPRRYWHYHRTFRAVDRQVLATGNRMVRRTHRQELDRAAGYRRAGGAFLGGALALAAQQADDASFKR